MYYVASYANPPATNTDAGRVKVPRGRLVAGGGVGLLLLLRLKTWNESPQSLM